VRLRSVEARGLRKRFAGFGISSERRPCRRELSVGTRLPDGSSSTPKDPDETHASAIVEPVRSRRLSVSVVLVLVLLGAAGLGCGASQGGNTTVSAEAQADPAQLAVEIDRSQAVIDGAWGSEASLRRAAGAQQLAFRQLADHRSLRRRTMLRLTPAARSTAVAALRAADALSKIVPAERRFPDWRIVAPLAPSKLLRFFRAASAAYKIPWQYLAAIELVETRMGRIRGLSPAGAEGPMQFMPATWAEYGRGSINDQRDSIMAAARFLVANGAHRNMGRALLHYNPSRSYVVAVQSYAQEMRTDRHAFYGYYFWQVLYQTTSGTFLLPVGYPRARPRRLPS
jgi:membrane-bound lytic murein transglycosylase B